MAKGLNRKHREKKLNTVILHEKPVALDNKKYLEKKLHRYVIASPDTGYYLVKTGFGKAPSYEFSKSIVKATKVSSVIDAKFVIECYHKDTGDTMDLVGIPLEITYELINETICGEISDEDYWKDLELWKYTH